MRAWEAALAEAGNPPAPEPTIPATTAPAPPTTALPAPTTTSPAPTTTAAAPTTTEAPPPTTVPPVSGGILDVLAAAGQFSQLLASIDAAGLTETLSGPGPFTLFAPTDDAFSQLAEPLPAEPEALQGILLYHVVEDDLAAFDLAGVATVVTAQGTEIAVTLVDGQIVLNDTATVTISNVLGSNGVVHVVNAVLLPAG
jgi:uncharacterized surface protein with fasciclin (FAS1) repeats